MLAVELQTVSPSFADHFSAVSSGDIPTGLQYSDDTSALPAVHSCTLRRDAPLESNRLFVESGIPDDGGRNLSIIGLDDPNTILREILIADVKGIAINHGLDHRRIQEA